MRAVVVEDIPDVREALVEMISTHCPEVEISGSAGSVVEAAKVIRDTNPDLLLLDVTLTDGTAFDLLDIVDFPGKVIFITASDAHAIRAFRYAALDYLLKPIDPGRLEAAISRASEMTRVVDEQMEMMRHNLDRQATPDRIALHTADRIHIVTLGEIVRCEADGNYTQFILRNKRPLLVAKTLKEYDKLMSEYGFLRVHQSHLVNLAHVKEYVKTDGTYLVMRDGSKIPVSTRKRQHVLAQIDRILHA